MRDRWLNVAFLMGALAFIAPFAAPVAVADDETAQAENAPEQANAPDEGGAPEQASPPVKSEKPKMVCKREPSTGSAIPTRVCRTPHQIEAARQAAKDNMNSVNDAQSGRTTSGGG